MRILIVAGLLALSACAPKLIGANETGGLVRYDTLQSAAVKAANAHCAKHSKVARVTNEDVLASNIRFECVNP